MTTKEILELIEEVNNLNFMDHIFLRPIGETVLEGRVWLKLDFVNKQNQYPVSMSHSFYFIKNKANKVEAAVEDRGANDLHWVISPDQRKKGYLTKALIQHILPHLFYVKKRKCQVITVNTAETLEDEQASRNVAIRAGFKPNSSYTYRMTKKRMTINPKELSAVDNPIDYQRTQVLFNKAVFAFDLLESITDELEMAYLWSGNLRKIVQQRRLIQVQIEDARFKGV